MEMFCLSAYLQNSWYHPLLYCCQTTLTHTWRCARACHYAYSPPPSRDHWRQHWGRTSACWHDHTGLVLVEDLSQGWNNQRSKKKQDTSTCSIYTEKNPSLVHVRQNYVETKVQRQVVAHLSSAHALTLHRSHNTQGAFLVPPPALLIGVQWSKLWLKSVRTICLCIIKFVLPMLNFVLPLIFYFSIKHTVQ